MKIKANPICQLSGFTGDHTALYLFDFFFIFLPFFFLALLFLHPFGPLAFIFSLSLSLCCHCFHSLLLISSFFHCGSKICSSHQKPYRKFPSLRSQYHQYLSPSLSPFTTNNPAFLAVVFFPAVHKRGLSPVVPAHLPRLQITTPTRFSRRFSVRTPIRREGECRSRTSCP